MALEAVCLTMSHRTNLRSIAEAMQEGIQRCGDRATLWDMNAGIPPPADVGVMYGWKHNELIRRYPRFLYADLSYWRREAYWKINCNGWSPDGYLRAGLPRDRWDALGIPMRGNQVSTGKRVLIAGASVKSAVQHGQRYMQWEMRMARRMQGKGFEVVYRPKPKDHFKKPIPGVGYDTSPDIDWSTVHAVVTHHSNVALDALVAGVPAYCETGAARCMSFHPDEIQSAAIPPGREQFLWDCAWLQWTLDEMRSGECWDHLKQRGLV